MLKESEYKALVLMATYNGERFLLPQIESILRQTGRRLHILIRDDHSDDSTAEMLAELENQHETIELVKDDRGRLGYAQNFSLLMREACRRRPDYILLSDQDDLWHPERSTRQIEALQRMERASGAESPCLSHSDLELIDEAGAVIAGSMWHQQGIHSPEPENALARLIAANYVTGCTMAMNRALLELATPVPAQIRHHDHWIALCAATSGRIESQSAPLVKYRQHGNNAIGVRSWKARPSSIATRIRGHRADIRRLPELLESLQQRCRVVAPQNKLSLLSQAATIARSSASGFSRYNKYKRLGIAPQGGVRPLLWLIKNLLY